MGLAWVLLTPGMAALGESVTVTGFGSGVSLSAEGDQLHFVWTPHAGGDVEFVARLAALEGPAQATAGLMLRADDSPQAPMVAFQYVREKQVKETPEHALAWTAREERVDQASMLTLREPAIWLKVVRLGGNFAVYKSAEGRFWVQVTNVSGGRFAHTGPLQVGLFASGGAKATFDHIYLGPPRMKWRTSWIGNSFGARTDDAHVSNTLSAMWVAPDGTCYTSAYWDEGGRPVTSYRDGRVARHLPIGTPQTAEGGITGDATHLYVASRDHINVLDPAAADFAPRRIHLSVNLVDPKTKHSIVTGLASNGRELFVADARDNLIRVVSLQPVKTWHKPRAANDGVRLTPEPVTPPDDPRAAPAIVYQSQHVGEHNRFTIPGLTPNTAYTLRCHLAEFDDRPRSKDPRRDLIRIQGQSIHVAEQAGGVLKGVVHDIADQKADAHGNVVIDIGAYGGPGICGFELIDAEGKQCFAFNGGGPATGGFVGDTAELVERAFPFERPGAMTFDRRGHLWIVQRGRDFPIGITLDAKYPAAIRCYSADGVDTGRAIIDVINPRGLGYDAARDELLVADNSADLQVRIFGDLDQRPRLVRTFGHKGGVYSGTPGLVFDPQAGGYARFAGLSGVGVDARGNLYVGGGFQGTDLRAFKPDGSFGWMLHSLMFCNTYDFDPASDGRDAYGTFNHVKLDLTKSEPGSEQQYVSYNWDLRRFGPPQRPASSQAIVRRLGPEQRLVMYTSGQGTVGDINLYRYEGELAIPAGGSRDKGRQWWCDANGNGLEDPDELTAMAPPIGWLTTIAVDSRGDLRAGCPSTGGSFMRCFTFKGFSPQGVPLYSGVAGEGWQDVRFPEEGDKTNAWGMACRLDYDADRDMMVVMYPAERCQGEKDYWPPYFLARYDRWSEGNRTPAWKVRTFSPRTHPQYFLAEVRPFPHSGYMGMKVVGDYVFMAFLFGELHVFDLHSGELAEIVCIGPEMQGRCAWEDAAMGLRAFKRSNGEYLIVTENSGWGGKNNFFRWKP